MKLRKKLSSRSLYLSLIAVFLISLIFLTGLYYVLNIQYQKSQNLFQNGPVTTLPKSLLIELDQPDQDVLSFSSSIIVSGTTDPSTNILISTDTNDFVIQSKADGSFSTVLNLDEGVNRVTVAVFDSTGDSRVAQRTVYYSKEKI